MRTPRINHMRHRHAQRIRHSIRLLEWLTAQADRLGATRAQVVAFLKSGLTARQVAVMPPLIPVPVNTVAPVLSGTPLADEVLSVTTGTWTGEAPITYSYSWLADGLILPGETGSTITVTDGNVDQIITARVTATNPGGQAFADSNPIGPITLE